jgi:hypothetical protein
MMPGTSLRGHALRSEGKPYMPGGEGEEPHVLTGSRPPSGHLGYALCECGAVSERLYSDRQRKLWHGAVHKPEVRAAAVLARESR